MTRSDGGSTGDASTTAQSFYGRWARAYDVVATYAPGVGGLRARTVDALDLSPGDTVVDVGCGTGANLAYLRDRVGESGRVIGLDFTPEMLDRAGARVRAAGWRNVDLVRGDAARPPVDDPVDAVLGSFVVGMLDDPAAAVDAWLDCLGPGGRMALLDGASSPRAVAAPLNLGFQGFVWLGTPGKFRGGIGRRDGESSIDRLDRRIDAAHGRLRERADGRTDRHALGFVVVTAGSI